MAAQIGKAGSSINLRLGERPKTSDPKLNFELQGVYNALHILNAYLDNIRNELEGTDEGTPADNLKFRRNFKAVAAQAVEAGDIVSLDDTGKVVKGIHRLGGSYSFGSSGSVSYWQANGPGNRAEFNVKQDYWYVAVNKAAIGELVEVGTAGALELPGAKCGQTVWAADARSIRTRSGMTNGTAPNSGITAQPFSGLGSLYLSNPRWQTSVGSLDFVNEGIMTAGYPYVSGDYVIRQRTFLYPIGICLLDDYVYIREFIKE